MPVARLPMRQKGYQLKKRLLLLLIVIAASGVVSLSSYDGMPWPKCFPCPEQGACPDQSCYGCHVTCPQGGVNARTKLPMVARHK